MEHLLKSLSGEKSLTKVVGVFASQAQAQAALGKLLATPGMAVDQARLLGPEDARLSRREMFSRTMEPEQRGIYKTIFVTHGILGLAAGIGGVLLYLWLLRSGQPMVTSSPLLAFIAIVGFATTFGLLLGGLVTMRPDHVWLINAVRSALKQNRWAVVVHPTDERQSQAAKETLQQNGAELLKSL